MTQEPQVQLNATAVLQVPLQSYGQDFTFIVNGENFHTSCIISQLISTKISQIHQNDPTQNTFTINTEHVGNFQNFLQLATFQPLTIPLNEIQFFDEVAEALGTDSIDISNIISIDITNENVVDLLQRHEHFGRLYRQIVSNEIEYLSSHFDELYESYKNEIKSLSLNTIERIISGENLKLKNENQLLKFINEIYREHNNFTRSDCARLYDYVLFINVDVVTIGEFIDNFRIENMSEETWRRISIRLRQSVPECYEDHPSRYAWKQFLPNGDQNFDGVFKYLIGKTNGNIADRVAITDYDNNPNCYNVTKFDSSSCYQICNQYNNWICFDFKTNKFIPTNYQIKTYTYGQGSLNPKSWIIEGSNDKSSWVKIAGENNCNYTNGSNLSHVFAISNPNEKKFRYIRMTQIGYNWSGNQYHFTLNNFELYGKFLEI